VKVYNVPTIYPRVSSLDAQRELMMQHFDLTNA
jgi:hypothetical protein